MNGRWLDRHFCTAKWGKDLGGFQDCEGGTFVMAVAALIIITTEDSERHCGRTQRLVTRTAVRDFLCEPLGAMPASRSRASM